MIFFFNLKFGPYGGVTQFATQFTPVFRQYRAQNRQQKFRLKKKCFVNMISDWAEND